MCGDRAVLKDNGWHYFLDGEEVSEKVYEERYPPERIKAGQAPGGHSSKCWPMVAKTAFAVQPDQVAEANERNAKHGCGVRYNEKGHAIINSAAEHRQLIKLESQFIGKGLVDRDSYY